MTKKKKRMMMRHFVLLFVLVTTVLSFSPSDIERDLDSLEKDVKLDLHLPIFGKKKPEKPVKPLATSGRKDQEKQEIGQNWDCYGIQWKIPS